MASRSQLIVALLFSALLVLLGLPAAAKATLAFNANLCNSEVWVSRSDDSAEAEYVGPA
jgi:hypothetical protein